MPGKKGRVARRRERLRSRSTPRGVCRLSLVQSQLAKRPNVGIKSVSFARSCVGSTRRPSWPAQHPQLKTPTGRPRMSQAVPVGRLPLRLPTPENPRVLRLLRRRAQDPSPRTLHRTPRLDDPARVRTSVAPTLRSGWRNPIGKKVIRPPNSPFKSLSDYRTYFQIRRDLSLPPSLVENTHKMNRRLDGVFQGKVPFTGTSPRGVFTFLTTVRRACDAAGLTHGQARPLLAFLLSGAAKRAFSIALNSQGGHRTYAIRTYGAAIIWLLAKNATHAEMASAYHDNITIRQRDNETPTAFGRRVETQCDRLDGLFDAQDVKDVFINGLSEIIQSHVRVLDGQFPKRTLADTISAAQMYWNGTNKLRLSLKLPRLQTTKVAYASPMPTRHPNVNRPFPVTQPRARSHSPLPNESPQARTDMCYNCYKPGHFAAQCAEPYRPRERRRFCQRACSVTSVCFESPTAWCSRAMCDSRLETDS